MQKLLTGFVIAWMEGAGIRTSEITDLYTKMGMKDAPGGTGDANMRYFLLDPQGEPVHTWVGHKKDALAEGIAKLKAPAPPVDASKVTLTLPDLCGSSGDSRVPAGLRLFVHTHGRTGVIVQPVPVKAEEWKSLSFPDAGREIPAGFFRSSVTQIFPAAIRAASTPEVPGAVTKIQGTLKLEPAGSDEKFRYAVVRGPVKLFYEGVPDKNNPSEPKFSGTLQVVLKYGLTTPEVHSLRGVIEGDYAYTPRDTFKMTAALESRPE